MRILLVNPPHQSIGSRIPREHLPPLGLLSIGGPLIDAGHDVALLDAEIGPLALDSIVRRVEAHGADALLIGHSGSTSAHPTICGLTRRVRARCPNLRIVYGGVFPTYHCADVLAEEPQIDAIVRGEGEETTPRLLAALEAGGDLGTVDGIAYRSEGQVVATSPARSIGDLDAYRVGWELADLARYSYYGGKRAVVMQFSRGCPHRCSYCGQREFWQHWRRRDPRRCAEEIAWLQRTRGVELVNLADENPTADRAAWLALCQELIRLDLGITLIGSTRADDIVRDADVLHVYRRAGVERFLIGIESTDSHTLESVRKDGSTRADREAIDLMRQHGILSLATWVADFDDVTDLACLRAIRQLLAYDPDQIMTLFVTPHRWTEYARQAGRRQVIQPDLRLWDYKHQVLASRRMPAWRLFLWARLMELVLQGRPKAIWRSYFQPDRAARHGMRWFTRMGSRVWPREWWGWLVRDRTRRSGPTLEDFQAPRCMTRDVEPVA